MPRTPLQQKTIAITGASGSLGRALCQRLYAADAHLIGLTSQRQSLELPLADGKKLPLRTVPWQVGQEAALDHLWPEVDILILNHGINVHGDRSPGAIEKSYLVNSISSWRLLEAFLSTVKTPAERQRKEVWVNTSEAEVMPAFSPLYELSKRAIGDVVTLRRLDAPCPIRKLILGPFKSQLNPVGVMSAEYVANRIVTLAEQGHRNIIVTINPLTYLCWPPHEWLVSQYFRRLSGPSLAAPSDPEAEP